MASRHCCIPMALLVVLVSGLHHPVMALDEYRFTGRTMGTTYQVKVVAETLKDNAGIQAQMNARLEQINQSMSTYRPQSEISRFNALTTTPQPFRISGDFLKVMLAGRQIHKMTQGAWDGTISPLVVLWGFGNAAPITKIPDPKVIAQTMEQVGFDGIGILAKASDGFLEKRRKGVSLDLGSIAKGYGVDQLAKLLYRLGFNRFLVEIGGEVYASGKRLDGRQWRVGINQPRKGGAVNAVYKVVPLENRAMATSGDYRNFVQIDGRYYSHIIDPHTGFPVNNGVVSVSVIAENCTLADGLATALMVMGPQSGIALLNNTHGVEGLIVVRQSDGVLQNHWSRGLVDAN